MWKRRKHAGHSPKILLHRGESRAFLFGQFSLSATGNETDQETALASGQEVCSGDTQPGPSSSKFSYSIPEEAVVQQITGPRCTGPRLAPFTHELIERARAGHQRHQGKGDNRLCQQEANMPGNTYKAKVRTDNCSIAIRKA